MKRNYHPPDREIIKLQLRFDTLLTGSVETGGVIIATENDDIPENFDDLLDDYFPPTT